MQCSHGSSIGLFYESYFLIFVVCLMFILFLCRFGFSVLFFYLAGFDDFHGFSAFDLILLRDLGFLCFVGLSWLAVSISLNLFSVFINEILDLFLLHSFF